MNEQIQIRARQIAEANIGNLVMELAVANATIEALRVELAQVKTEKPKDP